MFPVAEYDEKDSCFPALHSDRHPVSFSFTYYVFIGPIFLNLQQLFLLAILPFRLGMTPS